MRRQQSSGCFGQGVTFGQRGLGVKHINAGCGKVAPFQRGGQGSIIHNRAAGTVDEYGMLLHQRQLICTDQVAGLCVGRHMQRNDIAALQQLFQRYIFNPQIQSFLSDRAGLGDHFGAKGGEKACGIQADCAGAYNAHGTAGDLGTTDGHAAAAAGAVAFVKVTQTADGQTQCQLCYGRIGIAGSITDGDSFFLASIQTNMVDAGKGNIQQLQFGADAMTEVGSGVLAMITASLSPIRACCSAGLVVLVSKLTKVWP